MSPLNSNSGTLRLVYFQGDIYQNDIKAEFSWATVEKSIAYTLFKSSAQNRLQLQDKQTVENIKNEIISKIGDKMPFEFKSIMICNFIKKTEKFKAKEYIFDVVPGKSLNQPFLSINELLSMIAGITL